MSDFKPTIGDEILEQWQDEGGQNHQLYRDGMTSEIKEYIAPLETEKTAEEEPETEESEENEDDNQKEKEERLDKENPEESLKEDGHETEPNTETGTEKATPKTGKAAEGADKAAESLGEAGTKVGGAAMEEGGVVVAEGAAATSEIWGPVIIGVVVILAIIIIVLLAIWGYSEKKPKNNDCENGSASSTTIVLDPGHISESNQNDSGEPLDQSNKGALEAEYKYTWTLANKIKPLLEAKGYNVILTRSSEGEFKSNKARAEAANAANAALFLRLHNDSTKNSGFFFVKPNKIGNINKAGVIIGPTQSVLDKSAQATDVVFNASKGGITTAGMPIIAGGGVKLESVYAGNAAKHDGALVGTIFSKVPTTLVELGSLNNTKDKKLLDSEKFMDGAAKALADGAAAFVGTPAASTALTGNQSNGIVFPVKGTRQKYTGRTKGPNQPRGPNDPLPIPPESKWFHQWPIPNNMGDDQPAYGACRGGAGCPRKHSGIDIYAEYGTPVISPESGNVISFEAKHVTATKEPKSGGIGRVLVIKGASGREYRFVHLLGFSPSVTKGVGLTRQPRDGESKSGLSFPVKAGDIVAYVGNTGGIQNPHLHFEIKQAGANIDPTPFLNGTASASTGSCATSSSEIASKAIALAKSQIGKPYNWGGPPNFNDTNPPNFDCSGLVVWAFLHASDNKVDLRGVRTTRVMYSSNKVRIIQESELQPGDLIFNGPGDATTIHHVSIYIGNNMRIHAPNTGEFVREESVKRGENLFFARVITN